MWNDLVQQAVDFRRELHGVPETAWLEVETARRVRDRLTALGICWRACAKTGTVATLAPRAPGRHSALRADIDGLPIAETSGVAWTSSRAGCMHACGHDGHTAALWLAAVWLKHTEDRLPGPVTLLFQPAEEGGHGAKHMIEDGALEGVDAVYGWHNWPGLPEGLLLCPDGVVMSANGTFRITVTGCGGHGSQPEACRDPVLAGAAVVGALQQIVSRRLSPRAAAVVSVTRFHAGETDTVIPETAELSGSIRIADDGLRDEVNDLIREVATSTAEAYGTRAEVEIFPRYGATVNAPAEAARLRAEAEKVLGAPVSAQPEGVPVMASEDFSYYLRACPGAFALLGAGEGPSLHSAHYDFNDALLPQAARLLIRLAGAEDPAKTSFDTPTSTSRSLT